MLQLNAENSLTLCSNTKNPHPSSLAAPLLGFKGKCIILHAATPLTAPFPSTAGKCSEALFLQVLSSHTAQLPSAWLLVLAGDAAHVGRGPDLRCMIGAICGATQEEHSAVAFQSKSARKGSDEILDVLSGWYYLRPSLVLSRMQGNASFRSPTPKPVSLEWLCCKD